MRANALLNTLSLIAVDTLAVTAALFISHFERLWLDRFPVFKDYDGHWERFLFSGLLYGLLVTLFYFSGLYTRRNDFWEETRKIFESVFFLFIFIATYVFATKTALEYSRAMVLLMFFNMAWILPLMRVMLKRQLWRLQTWQIDAFVVGEAVQAEKLRRDLMLNWYLGYRPTERVDRRGVVFIATRDMPVDRLESLINRYKREVREVIVIPYLHNLSFANAEIVDLRIGQMSLINIQNQLFRPKNVIIKRVAETIAVLALLPLFLLVYAVIALWIRLDSPGPVLFRQTRLGQEGRHFACYKFRTMYQECDRMLEAYLEAHPEERDHYAEFHKYVNDPRITAAGYWLRRYSLDELPQMLNILRQEMSLIGPRPYMLNEKAKIGSAAETILHVKPGITGFWQIKGRNERSFTERVELDVWYIQNWSLWLDFIIFIKTFVVLVTRRGAR